MTENKLIPFEDNKQLYADSVSRDAGDPDLASKQQQDQKVRKTNRDVSNHTHPRPT